MMMRRRWGALVLGGVLLLAPTSLAPAAAQPVPGAAPAASEHWRTPPVTAPFTPEQLSATYASDTAHDYVPMLSGFTELVAEHPDVMESNLAQTIAINHAASPDEQRDAIVDQYADMAYSMADGLGEHLGALYLAALEEGRLPKTHALVSKNGGAKMVGWSGSTEPAKAHFQYPRPYLVAPDEIIHYDGPDGTAYNTRSGSFPSGHTSQAYWQGTTLAMMLPELAPQILARTSQAAHHRVVMGVHYPLDIMGGRMMGQKIVQLRWADEEYRQLMVEAAAELRAVLAHDCGKPLHACIASDTPYLSTREARTVYRDRMSYDFEPVHVTGLPMNVPPGAEMLLATSHPHLTAAQRRQVLELTALTSGYPLDDQSETGSWQRLDLAAAMSATVRVDRDGNVHLIGPSR